MFDALKLLDQFVGAGTADRINQATGGALGNIVNQVQGGLGQAGQAAQGVQEQAAGGLGGLLNQVQQGGLGGLLNQLPGGLGQAAQNAQEQAGGFLNQAQGGVGGMVDQARGMLDQVQQPGGVEQLAEQAKQFLGNNATGLMAGAAITGLAGLLVGTRGGRAIGGTALKLGGLALVGGLAYKAYQSWQAGQTPQAGAAGAVAQAPTDSGFASNAVPDANERAMVAMQAMISAAKSDGQIDQEEYGRIMGRMDTFGLDPEARAFLENEMQAPLDVDALIGTATTVERAVELYAASVVAIDPDTDAEIAYLDMMADRLGLNAELRAHLDAQASAVRAQG